MSNCPNTAIGNGVRSRPDFVDGLADREIAERLYLSRHTVSQYVKRIYRKLGVDRAWR